MNEPQEWKGPRFVPAQRSSRQDHEQNDSLACYKCYIKHLSKAAVQADEVSEDASREQEMSLCIGNIACAEDHARALGLNSDANSLRQLRPRVWERDPSVSRDILVISVAAIKSLRTIESIEERKAAREAEAEAARAAKEAEASKSAKEAEAAKDAPAPDAVNTELNPPG